MNAETKRKLTLLYRNWLGGGRSDLGLPFSLGDLIVQAGKFRRLGLSPAEHADVLGIPLEFAEDLGAAFDEGVTDKELQELATARVPARKPRRNGG